MCLGVFQARVPPAVASRPRLTRSYRGNRMTIGPTRRRLRAEASTERESRRSETAGRAEEVGGPRRCVGGDGLELRDVAAGLAAEPRMLNTRGGRELTYNEIQ